MQTTLHKGKQETFEDIKAAIEEDDYRAFASHL